MRAMGCPKVVDEEWLGFSTKEKYFVEKQRDVPAVASLVPPKVETLEELWLPWAEKEIQMGQAFFRRVLQRNLLDHRRECAKQRVNVMNEWCESEHRYFNSLVAAHKVFITKLRLNADCSDRPVLSREEVAAIFNNWDELIDFSSQLLAFLDLLKRRTAWDFWTSIGGPCDLAPRESSEGGVPEAVSQKEPQSTLGLEGLFPCLERYATYCGRYEKSIALVNEMQQKRPGFQAYLKQLEKSPDLQGQSVFSLLIMPVQRIPRYRLLTKELLKNTWEGHPDRGGVERAFDAVSNVAVKVNHAIRQAADLPKVIEIMQKVKGSSVSVVQANRKYLQDVLVHEVVASVERRQVRVFIFNDMLLCAREDNSAYCWTLPLAGAVVRRAPALPEASHGVHIVRHAQRSTAAPSCFTLLCRNEAELTEFVEVLRGAFKELRRRERRVARAKARAAGVASEDGEEPVSFRRSSTLDPSEFKAPAASSRRSVDVPRLPRRDSEDQGLGDWLYLDEADGEESDESLRAKHDSDAPRAPIGGRDVAAASGRDVAAKSKVTAGDKRHSAPVAAAPDGGTGQSEDAWQREFHAGALSRLCFAATQGCSASVVGHVVHTGSSFLFFSHRKVQCRIRVVTRHSDWETLRSLEDMESLLLALDAHVRSNLLRVTLPVLPPKWTEPGHDAPPAPMDAWLALLDSFLLALLSVPSLGSPAPVELMRFLGGFFEAKANAMSRPGGR